MTERISSDSLMNCLVLLTKLNNRPATVEALAYGLPFDPKKDKQNLFDIEKSKANFSRAAHNAGFTSTLVNRRIKDIPAVVLPAILLLKNESACVITAIDHKNKVAEIIIPDLDETPMEVEFEKLEKDYIGFSFLLKKNYEGFRPDLSVSSEDDKKNWFFGTMGKFKSIYGNVLLATLLINLFVIAGPMFTMNVYDRIIPHNAVDTLWVLAVGIVTIYCFDLILKYLRTNFLEVAAKKSDIILSSILFEQSLNLKMKEKPRSVGSFANSIKDFDSIRSFFASSAITAFIELPFVIIFLCVIYYIGKVIVVVPITAILLILINSFILRKPIKRISDSMHESSARRNGILVEALSNLETIKAFNANSSIQWQWEESTGDIAEKSLKSRTLSSLLSTFSAFLVQLNTVAVVIAGVYLIKEGELTMGGLIATVILSSRTIAPMSQVASLLSNFEQMRTGLTALNDLMRKEIERPEKKLFLRRPVFKGAIEFKNVSFAYPDETKLALTGINLKINPKERIGIIGQVGSGKSTIAKILMGFYDPLEGSVFVDGIDIRQIDPADLRHNFSYVPQDVLLFSGTVRGNITFKAPHSDDESIIRAAQIGNVTSFTDRHPMGLDLNVGERGSNLSGGQRQSVAVGRAFIVDSPIVLLDEPTNSMDFTSEKRVIDQLKEATKDKTTIVITHKPTILEIVDRIIVFDNGSVVMDGSKNEVLAKLGGKGK
jgi:ATP-binding cassette subfamily C protein LapB